MKLREIGNTSKAVLKTAVSPTKIAMYTAKERAIKATVTLSTLRYIGGTSAAFTAGSMEF